MTMQGTELRALRQQLGMTQEAFAQALGMSRKAVNEMEADKAPIERRTELAARYLAASHAPAPRLNVRASDVEWVDHDGQVQTVIEGFKVVLFPQTRGRWSISLEHSSGYRPDYPRWEDSEEAAKSSALLAVQKGLIDLHELQPSAAA